MMIANLGILGKASAKEQYKNLVVLDSVGHYVFLNAGLTFNPLPWCSFEAYA